MRAEHALNSSSQFLESFIRKSKSSKQHEIDCWYLLVFGPGILPKLSMCCRGGLAGSFFVKNTHKCLYLFQVFESLKNLYKILKTSKSIKLLKKNKREL